ncbi:MAG: hypothetical protein IPK81_03885 [Rhodospirillales bacterium]|nr:MAG: hypothetical protein IPK81_03885 [Rhodospirillales bacterium]
MVVMGVMIVAGLAVIAVELVRRMSATAPAAGAVATPPREAVALRGFGAVDVAIPEGARVESVAADGGRVVAHVRARDGASMAYVVDAGTGALLGIVRFPPGEPPKR